VFDQQEQVITNLSATTTSQSVVLTGFRAGEVREIQIFLTKAGLNNPNEYRIPDAVTVLYAGTIYANYANGAAAMWNLLDGTARSAAEQSALAAVGGGGGAMTSAPVLSEWTELPFAQPTGNDYDGEILVHGKQITNGIVNLQVQTPSADAYTLHVVYVYNCTLSFSKGSADLIF
jgi:hypothetical protein